MSGNQDLPERMMRKSQRKTESGKQSRIKLVRFFPVYFENNIKLEMHFKTNCMHLLMQT